MRGLADFERELNSASTLEERFKIVFEGLILNVFTCGLREIDRLNLVTLEIRDPEIYETVKDKGVREVLVKIGMYDVNIFKNPDKNAVELGFSAGYIDYPYDKLFESLHTIGAYKFTDHFETALGGIVSAKDRSMFYGGSDAVKVFLKALYALCKYICRSGDHRYVVNKENYSKVSAWLSLDKMTYGTRRRRMEDGLWRLGPICDVLKKHKRTIKKKMG